MADSAHRFVCTSGGAVAAGRRRLRRLLLALTVLMLAVALASWWQGRGVPALLAGTVAGVAFLALRMSGDLEPLWLEVGPDELTVQTRRQRILLPLPPTSARRLRADEIRHLEGLASAGGMVAGSGGFDSHRLGEFDLYASNLANAVLLESEDRRLVLTPDRPQEFLDRLVGLQPAAPARPLPAGPRPA